MRFADQVLTLIEHGPNNRIEFWEVVRFAQELAPDMYLHVEGDYVTFKFPDGSVMDVEYRKHRGQP